MRSFRAAFGVRSTDIRVLAIGRHVYPIEVEDTALFVVDYFAADDLLRLSLSDGTEQTVGGVALSYTEAGIYAKLDNGLTARFARQALRFCGTMSSVGRSAQPAIRLDDLEATRPLTRSKHAHALNPLPESSPPRWNHPRI